ncbi:hypothetical protein D9619_002207 [Psilocybe cf. subviscida]|uniref:Rhodopsin domain-containing protein n=1 Tax=Psilocybe cf. subviscida TaxID=2480587 RepID=A0A8H5F3L9_9AGAR|nr:hypothetical protein D9619_002207 [Psilocybe cf. subviscida]
MQLPSQSYETWRVCMTMLHILAILSSCFRVAVRHHAKRIWWDDYLILLPTGTDTFFLVTLWMYPPITPESISNSDTAFTKMWSSAFPCYTTIWMSRTCFMLSLARIFPPFHTFRRSALSFAVFFTTLFCASMLIVGLRCDTSLTGDPKNPPTRCIKPGNPDITATFGFTAETLSGVILVSYPLAMLKKFSLPIFEKRMLFVALLSSAFTLLLVLALAVITYGPFTKDLRYIVLVYMLSHMAGALALIACNMLVFMSVVIRKIRNRGKNNITLQSWLRQANARDVPFVMGLQDPNPWPSYPPSQTGPSHQTHQTSRGPNNLTVLTVSSYAQEAVHIESEWSQGSSRGYTVTSGGYSDQLSSQGP